MSASMCSADIRFRREELSGVVDSDGAGAAT
jgi:hypothetical protein